MDPTFIGIVRSQTIDGVDPSLSAGARFTSIAPQEARPPESAELHPQLSDGSVVLVRGVDQGGWVYSAEVVDEGGPLLAKLVVDQFSRQQPSDADVLTALNLEFARNEARGEAGQSFFDQTLDDGLQFRRANGQTVDKSTFLESLGDAGNVNELLVANVDSVSVRGDQAVAQVTVWLKGTRGGQDVDNVYRNLRLFDRQGPQWRCVMWFNQLVPGRTASHELSLD